MSRKKLEEELWLFSSKYGFLLPGDEVAPLSFYAPLALTPNRQNLFLEIIRKARPRAEVEAKRKQIWGSKLKGQLYSNLCQSKKNVEFKECNDQLSLWRKKESLNKELKRFKQQLDTDNEDVIEKLTELQKNVCELAELEKHKSDLREKKTMLRLFLSLHSNEVVAYKKLIQDISQLQMCSSQEDLTQTVPDGCTHSYSTCNKGGLCETKENDKHGHMSTRLVYVVNAVTEHLSQCTSEFLHSNELPSNETKMQGESTTKSGLTTLKLAVVNYSASAAVSAAKIRSLNMEKDKIIEKHLKIDVHKNKSFNTTDPSFTDDFFVADCLHSEREDKIIKIKERLEFQRLKKEKAELLEELAALKIQLDTKKEEHYRIQGQLDPMQVQCYGTVKENIRALNQSLNSLKCDVKELHCKVQAEEEKLFLETKAARSAVSNGIVLAKNFVLSQTEALLDVQLDALKPRARETVDRQIRKSYGGECKEFFTSTLFSPFHSQDTVIRQIETRKEFLDLVQRLLHRNEPNEDTKLMLIKAPATKEHPQDNFMCVAKINNKCKELFEQISSGLPIVKRTKNAQKEQPFRKMIPPTTSVRGMTLVEFEAEYQSACRDMTFYSTR